MSLGADARVATSFLGAPDLNFFALKSRPQPSRARWNACGEASLAFARRIGISAERGPPVRFLDALAIDEARNSGV